MSGKTTQADERSITNCKFETKCIGKNISSSKIKLRWEFQLSDKLHNVELFDSKISGKKKIVADGVTVYPAQV
jgi:hypothetical protein